MDRWAGKVAVVTGASAGIGKAIALTLAKYGMTVVGLARNMEKLKQLATENKNVHALQCDLTNENNILNSFQVIEKEFGGVDLLVNNAGYISFSKVMDGSTDEWRKIFDTNVMGLSICSKEAIKSMKNRSNGHIININSTSGHTVDYMYKGAIGMYCASKFTVTALTETLRRELRAAGSRINITSVSPGYVYTDMGVECAHQTKDYDYQEKHSLPSGFLSTQDIADAIVSLISLNPRIEIQELTLESNEPLA